MASASSAGADKFLSGLALAAFGAGGVGLFCNTCLFNVDGGQRAVMWNVFGGVSDKIYGEGTHVRLPWFQRPHVYSIQIKPKLIQTTTGTKDLQMATIHVRLLYRPVAERLPAIHKSLGPDFAERVLPSVGNEVLKAVVARYNAEQLLTQREKVSREIRNAVVDRCQAFDIALDDVAITHLNYGKEFAKAIEEKQVAEQEAERQKFVVAKTEQERIATVIRAEGEAEAATMISKALKEHGTGLIEVRRIDAAREIAETLAKSPNVMYLPEKQNTLLGLGSAAQGGK
ncbi:hypothetical protein FOZ61_003359 [Perkinsus olseni]|uniref:Prohibitin n=3 Tax=Perkinsus olseni TaxID=32597 RepID=A0A7J6QSB8_PEROL|nr:hypothetical protein FOZ61_003359 [Perkinsus olseni]KAF4688592.1 hypothetical protein FOZ60_002584 [Perkinsus olseni]KAF4711519.1 hypothetical protein FOZ62_024806 [Perkinsus olseni]